MSPQRDFPPCGGLYGKAPPERVVFYTSSIRKDGEFSWLLFLRVVKMHLKLKVMAALRLRLRTKTVVKF